MDSREYTLKELRVGDYEDDFGNTWCDAIFAEYGEPVRWVLKEPTGVHEGLKYYGHIEEKTSKANKPYNRFYRDKPEEHAAPSSVPSAGSSWVESPEKQASIQRSVALQQAVVLAGPLGNAEDVLVNADKFYAWLQHEDIPKPPTTQNDPHARDIAVGSIPEYDQRDM